MLKTKEKSFVKKKQSNCLLKLTNYYLNRKLLNVQQKQFVKEPAIINN